MNKTTAAFQAQELMNRSKIAFLGTIDENGFPNVKAMLNLKHDELYKVWFSTNTSSKRVAQLKTNPNVCAYYADEFNFMGLQLIGTAEIRQDTQAKTMLWREGFEKYYPKGIDDHDYSVIEISVHTANFYHGQANITFAVEAE